MTTQDLLSTFLIIAIFCITICIVFATYYFVQTLRSIQTLAENLENTTQSLKDKLQLRVLAAIPALLIAAVSKVFKKRG